jgi:hypothetical protein
MRSMVEGTCNNDQPLRLALLATSPAFAGEEPYWLSSARRGG